MIYDEPEREGCKASGKIIQDEHKTKQPQKNTFMWLDFWKTRIRKPEGPILAFYDSSHTLKERKGDLR